MQEAPFWQGEEEHSSISWKKENNIFQSYFTEIYIHFQVNIYIRLMKQNKTNVIMLIQLLFMNVNLHSRHEPPFWQGEGEHSSISVGIKKKTTRIIMFTTFSQHNILIIPKTANYWYRKNKSS